MARKQGMKRHINFLTNLMLIKLLKRPSPISGVFWVTQDCNCRCKMCNIWNSEPKKEMDFPTFKKIFMENKFLRRLNLVVFSGGEPFIKDDLPEFVDVVNRYSPLLNISFASNGFFTGRIVSMLRAMLSKNGAPINIKISLDGIGQTHDEIRGVEGSFKRALATLSQLQELKLRHPGRLSVSVGFTATAINYRQMPEVIRLAAQNSADFFYKPVLYAETLKNENFDKEFLLSDRQKQYLRQQHREIIYNMKKCGFAKKFLYLKYLDFLSNYYKKPGRHLPCYACLASFHISAEWDVFSCLKYSYTLGNLKEGSFDEILDSRRADLLRKEIKKAKCHCLCTGDIFPSIIVRNFPLFLA